jgi:hypothetical protein
VHTAFHRILDTPDHVVIRMKRPLNAITLITPSMSYDLVKKSLQQEEEYAGYKVSSVACQK